MDDESWAYCVRFINTIFFSIDWKGMTSYFIFFIIGINISI